MENIADVHKISFIFCPSLYKNNGQLWGIIGFFIGIYPSIFF